MLGSDPIVVKIDGRTVSLRPSLRAGLHLVRRHNDFATISKAILDGNLTIMREIVQACSLNPDAFAILFGRVEGQALAKLIAILQPPLLNLVLQLAGIDGEAKDDQPQADKPVAFTDHFERLFTIATGQLGWTPETAWHATPAEIIAAHKGRVELLQMIFGNGSKTTEAKPHKALSLDEKARLFFAGKGTVKAKQANKESIQ